MNKKIFIGIGIIAFLLLVVSGYFFWKLLSGSTPEIPVTDTGNTTSTYPETTETPNKKPEVTTTQPEKTSGMSIQTKDGGNIFVNDFSKNPKISFDGEGDATIKTDPNYTILYYKMDQSFFIGLLGGNLPQVRKDAEKELLSILGISEEEACKIKVSTTVPVSVNEKAAGKDYGLSFCPNSTPFPKNL
jgi:hypothetical protein